MTTTAHDLPTFPRDHQHCMDRTGTNYVPCTSLTHCPSICDCPVSACTAEPTDHRESLVSLMSSDPRDFWSLMEAAEIEAGEWFTYTDENGDKWMTTDPNWEQNL